MISIIVPIYNCQAKLEFCLDSISQQEEDDFECILVDDGSTDESPSICDAYTKRDSRFKVIHKKNGGVSSARNAGLDCARGKWVVFVDSDDTIRKNHLSSLLATAEQHSQTDWILCGYVDILPDKEIRHSYQKHTWFGVMEVADFFCNSDLLGYMIPWDKMFRNSVIQEYHLRFDEKLSISEDRLFCYQYMLYVSGVATTGQATYIHDATDMNSLSNRSHPFYMLAHRYEKLSAAMRELLKHYSISGNDAYPFLAYDWGNFKSAIFSALSENKSVIKSARLQGQLYSRCFYKSFYTTSYQFSTREDRLIADGKFFLLNVYTCFKRLISQKFKV